MEQTQTALQHLQEISTTLRQTQGRISKLIKITCSQVAIWLCKIFKLSLSQDHQGLMGLSERVSHPQALTRLSRIDKQLSCTLRRRHRGGSSHKRCTRGSSANNTLAQIRRHWATKDYSQTLLKINSLLLMLCHSWFKMRLDILVCHRHQQTSQEFKTRSQTMHL